MPRVSVVIITKDEERNLPACLASVAWADEIVVVDSGSADRTVAIAREHTDLVFDEAWLGFGPQKNLAVSRATGEWVLSLDADERVTPELAREIAQVTSRAGADGYEIPRRSSYCGQVMRYGDWGRDRVLRLFRRERGRFSDDRVHERVIVDGAPGRLRGAIEHEAIRDHAQMLRTIDRYSEIWADEAFAAGRRASFTSALARGGWAFVRTALLRGGVLDGRLGVALSIATAEGVYYRYLKLHQRGRGARR